jgi:hypothetical protein
MIFFKLALTDSDQRQLRELGILIVQEASKCTHLASPSILRTPKFVTALAYSPVFISLDYVTECLEQNQPLDPSYFPLVDRNAERRLGFALEEARLRAQANKHRLLHGYHICCMESIRGGFDAFKSIVEANGGVCTLFRGRFSMNENRPRTYGEESDNGESKPETNDVYLLSGASPDQVKLWPRFRQLAKDIGKSPRIVQVNWLLDIAMSQEICWKDEYELSEKMIDS